VRVAFFSTGDELRSIGDPLGPGEVYDSNRYTLWAMLQRLGVELVDLGVVRDDPVALEHALRCAAQGADAVISSGGVSVGEADFTRDVMARVGEVAFWTIAMRPGRPMAVGRVGEAVYFGLPGNPVAVMVTFLFFARDALLRMAGARPEALLTVPVRSVHALRKRAGRTEYQRAVVSTAGDGELEARVTGQQGSGVLRSMAEANAMLVLRHEQGDIAAGDSVDALLFDGLL
jgi:molybdopterin molybdotransferase